MRSVLPLSFAILLDAVAVHSSKIPFSVHTVTRPRRSSPLFGRATEVHANTTTGDNIPLRNQQNTFYVANINLGGVDKPVMLDTGSSDLWVTGNIPNAQDSGVAATISYAVGQAGGDINFATMKFDDYTVEKQAFLYVKDTSSFSANITAQGYDGLIGLGPNSGSVVRDKLDQKNAGDTPMNRIFSQNKTTQNYITMLLDRSNDPDESFTGQMTISELAKGFENITQTPKLPVFEVHKLTKRDQHWQITIDKDGILGPDGQPIHHDGIVHGTDDKLVAVLDSGFTFPQVPRDVADAIYGRVPGANYDSKEQIWTIPCDIEVNLTFVFGGVKFPVHPLDVSNDDFNTVDDSGNHICLGSFQPISTAFSLLGEYDMILGMSFLRNAYALYDFGDFISEKKSDTADPFVQMLPLASAAQNHKDFVTKRLGGIDTTGDAAHQLLPANMMKHSPQTDAEKKALMEGKVLRQWPYILLGGLAFVALVVGLIVWRCCCGGRRGAGCCGKRKSKAPVAVIPMVNNNQKYQSLSDPAPSSYSDPYRR